MDRWDSRRGWRGGVIRTGDWELLDLVISHFLLFLTLMHESIKCYLVYHIFTPIISFPGWGDEHR